MLLTCRSSRWALAGVLYSIRLCVCRSTGRLQGPVQTNAFSSLSTDHNTAHKHWTDKTKRWGGRRRGRLSQCTVITHKKGRPWVNPFICSSLLLRATATATATAACDSCIVLLTGSLRAGRKSSSRNKPAPHPHPCLADSTSPEWTICVRHAVSEARNQFMHHKATYGFKVRVSDSALLTLTLNLW